jgi:hypothetical protein
MWQVPKRCHHQKGIRNRRVERGRSHHHNHFLDLDASLKTPVLVDEAGAAGKKYVSQSAHHPPSGNTALHIGHHLARERISQKRKLEKGNQTPSLHLSPMHRMHEALSC